MATTQGNPLQAPYYSRHRSEIVALDTGTITNRKRGINMASYFRAHIQVIPTGGANPTVEVLWWSEAASRFISEHTAITKAGDGANTPYEFTVECRGRIMFVYVSAGTLGNVEIMVSGFSVERA